MPDPTPTLDEVEADLLKSAGELDSGDYAEDFSEQDPGDLAPGGDQTDDDAPPSGDGEQPGDGGDQTAGRETDSSNDTPPAKGGDDTPPKAEEGDGEKPPEGDDAEDADKTPYQRALDKQKKERERLSRSWESLDSEKTEVRTKEEDLQKREAEIEARERAAEEVRYGPEDYDRAADSFEEAGKDDLAKAARQKAERLRKEGPEEVANLVKAEAETRDRFISEWNANKGEAEKRYPDLADPKSDFHQRTVKLLQEIPALSYTPDGILHAARGAEMQIAEESVSRLGKELAEAKAEIKRLSALTGPTPPGRPPGRPPAQKPVEDMSEEERTAHLLREAREHDRGVTA